MFKLIFEDQTKNMTLNNLCASQEPHRRVKNKRMKGLTEENNSLYPTGAGELYHIATYLSILFLKTLLYRQV